MTVVPEVISVHGPHALSGVTTWAARMSGLEGVLRHRMLVVRREGDADVGLGFPGAEVPGFEVLTLPDGSTVADEVLAIAGVLRSRAPSIALVHDHIPSAVAAAIVARNDVGIAGVAHADEPRYAELFDRIGGLLDVWWGDSAGACERASNASCADVCAGALAGGSPRVESPGLTRDRFGEASPARLLWLGRVERYQKRALDAVEVISLLVASGVPAELTIAGDGPALGAVRARINELGLAGVCRAVGSVAHGDVDGLLRDHDALVMTSAFEGTPVAAAEAAHHGCALFVTDGCGGLVDLAHEGGVVVTPTGDVRALAEEIACAVRTPGALRELGERALAMAREHLDQSRTREAMDRALHESFAARRGAWGRSSGGAERWACILRAIDALDGVEQSDVVRLRDAFVGSFMGEGERGALGCELPRLERLNERLIREAVDDLRARGVDRIALYGAGHHTRSAERVVGGLQEIVLVIDDSAHRGETIGGVPVVTPCDERVRTIGAVVVSSSEHEESLAARAGAWAGGRPVVRLYRQVERTRSVGVMG